MRRRLSRRMKFRRTIFKLLVSILLGFAIFMILNWRGVGLFHRYSAAVSDIREAYELMDQKNPVRLELRHYIEKQDETVIAKELEEKRMQRREELERLKEEEKNRKIAYLTFDDGPSSSVTPQVLKILDDYGVKATFFVVGTSVEANPEILKDAYRRGHAIGNHTYTHNYGYLYKKTENFIGEVQQLDALLKQHLGDDFKTGLLRFPGGCFEQYKMPMKETAEKLGYTSYNWNCLNGDAEGPTRTKEQLLQRVKATANGQKHLIILMHDTNAKQTTADSLRSVIEWLKSQGYEFRALPM